MEYIVTLIFQYISQNDFFIVNVCYPFIKV